VGALDSLLYVLTSDGSSFSSNFPFNCDGTLVGCVAVGDADDDGDKEIAIACHASGKVWLLTATGDVESGWPITVSEGTTGGMTLADVSGDDVPDLIWGSKNDSVYVYTGSGVRVPGWPVKLGADIHGSGAGVADVDDDGEPEVLICSISELYCFEANGTEKWSYASTETYRMWSSPSIGPVSGDGSLQVAFTSLGLLDTQSKLYLLDAATGTDMPGWTGGKPMGQNLYSSVAIGYLDTLGGLCQVVAPNGGCVGAYDASGAELWNRRVSEHNIRSTPIISDLDGDRSMEITVGTDHRVYVLEATSGDTITAYCRSVGSDVWSTVAVGDLDNDGDLEMVAAEVDSVIHVWDLPGSIWADGQEWPQFQRDAARTGLYVELVAPVAPELFSLEVVPPDSLKLVWGTVDEDIYGRDEAVTSYLIYRGDEAYEDDWSTLAGEVAAPETTYTEWSGTVGDVDNNVFYRVKAEDMHGNRSALSNKTYGEHEISTEGRGQHQRGQRD
jgi:hypothetical protein